MSERKAWAGIAAGTIFIGGGLGALIYMQQGSIEESRAEVASLRSDITEARRTIQGTADLEREVIVLREAPLQSKSS